jgi:osmotically-inducible protein OsmY
MRILLASFISFSLLLGGCSSIISATTDGPLHEDYGRRTPGTAMDDDLIETKVEVNLSKTDATFDAAHVNVHAYNGVVLLVGQVPTDELKNTATEIAQKTRKVRRVHNELEVAGPVSSLAKANDAWITGKIKSKLLLAESVQSDRVVVVTENGVTYLMGLLTNEEAERAADIARNTSGVRKVVKIFEIIE